MLRAYPDSSGFIFEDAKPRLKRNLHCNLFTTGIPPRNSPCSSLRLSVPLTTRWQQTGICLVKMDAENNIQKHIVWDCHYSHFWLGGCPAGTAPTQAPCNETPTPTDQSLGWDKENTDFFFPPKNPSKSRQNLPHFPLPGWPSCPRPLKSGNIH